MKKFRCVKCGYEMRKNLKFCPECGQKIEEIDKMDELYTDDKENKAEKTYKFSAMLKRINIKFVIIGGIVLIVPLYLYVYLIIIIINLFVTITHEENGCNKRKL